MIQENYSLDSFVLEPPRHLLYDLGFLRSIDDEGREISNEINDEFLPKEPDKKIRPEIYVTPAGLKGTVYRSQYTLRHRLTTWKHQDFIEAGEKILLFSIVKYNPESFEKFVRSQGWKTQRLNLQSEVLTISTNESRFRYAIFPAFR